MIDLSMVPRVYVAGEIRSPGGLLRESGVLAGGIKQIPK
jgi:hypothetical protein